MNGENINSDICPFCGKETVGGICLDCGDTNEEYRPEENSLLKDLSMAAQMLEPLSDETEMPQTEEVIGEPDAASPDNPYASVINYEEPDYGDNYAEEEEFTFLTDDRAMTLTQEMDFKPEKTLKSYWWLILIGLLVPYELAIPLGGALVCFDEKKGKTAGRIIVAVGMFKLIISFFIKNQGE